MSGKVKKQLTPRQRRFVTEYIVDLNATQAAIRAGYAEKTANREGTRLLSNAVIQKKIEKQIRKQEERTEITGDQVIKDLAIVAKLGERKKGTKVTNNQVKAYELLGKHFKLFTDIVEHGFTWKEFAEAAAKAADGGDHGSDSKS